MQHQNLPVPVTPPNQQAMMNMQNLPFNPPFVIPVQVTQQIQQYAPYITGATLAEIISNAGKNELRSFFLNLLSNNNWQNPEFGALVQRIANISEMFILGKQMQPQQAIAAAAAEGVLIELAKVAFTFQQPLSRYITQELANNLNATVGRGTALEGDLQRFYSMMQQPQQQHQMAYQQHNQMPSNAPNWMQQGPQMGNIGGGYPPPQQIGQGYPQQGYHGGGIPMQQQNYGGGMNPALVNRPSQNSMYQNQGPQIAQPAFRSSTNAAGGEMMGGIKRPRVRAADNMELTMEPGGKRELRVWRSDDEAERIDMNVARNAPNQGQPFQFQAHGQIDQMPDTQQPVFTAAPVEEETWPKYTNPEHPYDGMIFQDGSELRPAFKSGWEVTLSMENPYRTIYDPTQFVLFHLRRPDGTVTERLETRTEEMEYLDHELNPELRKQQREKNEENGPEIVPIWNLAAKMRHVKDNFSAIPATEETQSEDTSADLPTAETHVVEDLAPMHSLREAELKLAMLARSSEVKDGSPVEMCFDIIEAIVPEGSLISTLKMLETATSFEELQVKLCDVDKQLDDETRDMIDKRLTRSINEALEFNLGLIGWKMDSFREDYEDLVQALKDSQYGEALADVFCNAATEVIGRSLSVLSGDGYVTYLQSIGADATDSESGLLLGFRDRCSITQVPWTFADLKLDLNGGGLIPQASMPELYGAVAAIFERTPDFPVTYAYRLLQTADRKLIELRRGYLGSDAYLMFEYQDK